MGEWMAWRGGEEGVRGGSTIREELFRVGKATKTSHMVRVSITLQGQGGV